MQRMHGVGDGETSQEKAPSFLDLGRACFPAAKKRSPCTHRRQPPIGRCHPSADAKCYYTYMHASPSTCKLRAYDPKSKISWTTSCLCSSQVLSAICLEEETDAQFILSKHTTHLSIDVFIRIALDHQVFVCERFSASRHLADLRAD
ncbi:hypothetical protein OPV22_025060 [Ensete ventricosum]|uniref:Uncharacterized protein n=1 Tax=Ensete ventricosum TaxID=4639 RepID=A0AAV8QGL6_ENSVE|nr:hypothetical protein OPV22_025060 [Ensete ventricosum]